MSVLIALALSITLQIINPVTRGDMWTPGQIDLFTQYGWPFAAVSTSTTGDVWSSPKYQFKVLWLGVVANLIVCVFVSSKLALLCSQLSERRFRFTLVDSLGFTMSLAVIVSLHQARDGLNYWWEETEWHFAIEPLWLYTGTGIAGHLSDIACYLAILLTVPMIIKIPWSCLKQFAKFNHKHNAG